MRILVRGVAQLHGNVMDQSHDLVLVLQEVGLDGIGDPSGGVAVGCEAGLVVELVGEGGDAGSGSAEVVADFGFEGVDFLGEAGEIAQAAF